MTDFETAVTRAITDAILNGDPDGRFEALRVDTDALPDNELPGMWEAADFTGGLDEVRR